nr:hypothetical protein [uncultured Treponema sp.]
MKALYALQGVSKKGKSSTLNILIDELAKKYPNATKRILIPGRGRDQQVIFYNLNGHIIGIETQGDPNSRLPQSLKDFATAQCDIIFCACRTSGSTVDAIQNFAKQYSYTVNIIKQPYEKNGCKFIVPVFYSQGQPLVLGWPCRLIFS